MRRCRECGCLEEAACVRDGLLGDVEACHWVEVDLCSACAEEGEIGASELLGWEHPPRAYTDQFAQVAR